MYNYKLKSVSKKTLSPFYFFKLSILIVGLIGFIVFSESFKITKDIFFCVTILFIIVIFFEIIGLIFPKNINPIIKFIYDRKEKKLVSEGKDLGAFFSENSINFTGVFSVAVLSNGNKYISTMFTELTIDLGDIYEVLIKKDNVIINFSKNNRPHNFLVSNYFENTDELCIVLKKILQEKNINFHYNF